jgi:hypothetical protein
VDPLNPQTWNRYVYVNNNPLAAVDPAGLMMNNNINEGGGSFMDEIYLGWSTDSYSVDFIETTPWEIFTNFNYEATFLAPYNYSTTGYWGVILTYTTSEDLGTITVSSTSISSMGGGGGNGTSPNNVSQNNPPTTTNNSTFMQKWAAQLACEASVMTVRLSNTFPLYSVSLVGIGKGMLGNVPAGLAGLGSFASVGLADTVSAREMCVSAIWGPGHF